MHGISVARRQKLTVPPRCLRVLVRSSPIIGKITIVLIDIFVVFGCEPNTKEDGGEEDGCKELHVLNFLGASKCAVLLFMICC